MNSTFHLREREKKDYIRLVKPRVDVCVHPTDYEVTASTNLLYKNNSFPLSDH